MTSTPTDPLVKAFISGTYSFAVSLCSPLWLYLFSTDQSQMEAIKSTVMGHSRVASKVTQPIARAGAADLYQVLDVPGYAWQ